MAAAVSNLTQGLAARASTAPDQAEGMGSQMAVGLPTPPDSLAPQQPSGRVPYHAQLGNPSFSFYTADGKASAHAGPTPAHLDGNGDETVMSDAPQLEQPQQSAEGNYPDNRGTPITGTSAEQIAKFYLPKMLLYKGEKKIGQLMKELCEEAPAYAALEPPRRRRLMDAALAYSAGGGLNGAVTFTKTNWGLWKASETDLHRAKAIREWVSVPRGMPSINETGTSPPDSTLGSYQSGVAIPSHRRMSARGDRRESSMTHSSAASSLPRARNVRRFSHNVFEMDEDDDAMSVDEEDNMAYVGYRHADDLHLMDDGSDTEVEDWESMGPEKLRAGSVNSTGGGILPKYIAGRGRSFSRQAQSVPNPRTLGERLDCAQRGMPGSVDLFPTLDFSGTDFDAAERAATEALMRMGSMPSRASVASQV